MFIPFRDSNPIRHTPVALYTIVAINVAVFLWMNRLPEFQQQVAVFEHGFVPARIAQLSNPQPLTVEIPEGMVQTWRGPMLRTRQLNLEPIPKQIFLSLLTCMFMHGGWLHLIGNMWFLWIFGDNIEDQLGSFVFVIFYLVGGMLASAAFWVMDPAGKTPVIGASGAVATILGAYAITWPWARVQTLVFLVVFVTIIELPALVVLGGWFLMQLLEGTKALGADRLHYATGVAWWAHVGGFVAGLLLMPPLHSFVRALRADDPDEPADAILVD
jgi:membrane associated rhomboid family serine protease